MPQYPSRECYLPWQILSKEKLTLMASCVLVMVVLRVTSSVPTPDEAGEQGNWTEKSAGGKDSEFHTF